MFRPPVPSYDVLDGLEGALHELGDVPCLIIESKTPSSIIMIHCHGNATDVGRIRETLELLADQLGVNIVAVEYPGYGCRSDEKPSKAGLDVSVLKVYSYLRNEVGWPACNILVMGRSIGSGPATSLASHNRPGALILVSLFSSIEDLIEQRVGHRATRVVTDVFRVNGWNNLEQISQVECPVLLLHGSQDKIIPCSHSTKLFHLCKNGRISYLPRTGHSGFRWLPIIKVMKQFLHDNDIFSNAKHTLMPFNEVVDQVISPTILVDEVVSTPQKSYKAHDTQLPSAPDSEVPSVDLGSPASNPPKRPSLEIQLVEEPTEIGHSGLDVLEDPLALRLSRRKRRQALKGMRLLFTGHGGDEAREG
uniref:Serine aminopeptidase S33 domain-containing protein n=1 Tax=Heterosigma akashiwo TaxID=2829 RepID=A0A7S3XMG0_HETAK